MKRAKIVGVSVLASILTLAIANTAIPPAAAAAAAPRAANGPTQEELAAMSPEQQAVILGPLRSLANAVEIAGRGADTDIYTGLALRPATHSVDVWMTDVSAANRLLADARKADPSIDVSLARILPARHTRLELDTAAAHIAWTSATLPYRLNSMSVKQDGSGIELGVDNPTTAQAQTRRQQPSRQKSGVLAAEASGVKITFAHKALGRFSNGPANPGDDSPPYIAGDGITASNVGCTLGLPAVRKSDGHPFIFTAGHCYPSTTRVKTASGNRTVGQVTAKTPTCTAKGQANCWDAEVIDAPNNADAAIGPVWHPIVSVAYSGQGDFVCQDGYTSYQQNYWGRCGSVVTDPDAWLYGAAPGGPAQWVRGVDGYNANGGGAPGDSGALVYVYSGTNNLQARGSLSSAFDTDVFWAESIDYLNFFGMKLNPQQ